MADAQIDSHFIIKGIAALEEVGGTHDLSLAQNRVCRRPVNSHRMGSIADLSATPVEVEAIIEAQAIGKR